MKNSFRKIAIAGALAGVMVIGGVGAVALANGNAYENFKAAAFKTMEAENMTTNMEFTVKQDGETIITGNTTAQADDDNSYSLTKLEVSGQRMEVESSSRDDSLLTRIDDEYYSFDDDMEDYYEDYYDDDDDQYGHTASSEKFIEAMADLLVGDLKSHFVSNGDRVTVSLEGAQVPELLNLAVSAMVEEKAAAGHMANDYTGFEALHQAMENMPITQQASISRLSMDTAIKDGYLGDSVFTIVLTGKDDAGATHEMEIVCTSAISAIGSTTPSTIDTTGKTVIEGGWGFREK